MITSRLAIASCLFCVTLVATPTLAEEATPASGGSVFDETIVVTARKREETLQDTPISVSAFSGRGLEARGIQNTEGLAQVTPNLTLQNNPGFSGASNSATIYIRGIGQQDFVPTVEPGVGVYVDGVYVARSVGSILDLVDFERIEVLRGPQGTLFGRNTIGGAISITTKAPSKKLEASAAATYGTDNQVILKGMVNLPLNDKAALRASVGYFNQDGYVRRTYDGMMLGDVNRLTGRVALKLEPTDSWTTDLFFDGTRARENGPAMSLIGINYGRTTDPNTPPFVDISNTIANVMSGGGMMPCATAAAPLNPAVPGCYDNSYVLGHDTNAGTAPSYSNSDIWGAGMSHAIELTDGLKLKLITAYRHLSGTFARDGDASPVTIAQYYDRITQKQFSQEVQLLGDNLDGRLNWILGGYYFKEKGNNINRLLFTISEFQSGGAFGNESLAFFGQGTFKVTPRLKLTAGLRYTKDKKSFHPDQYIIENRVAFLGAPFNSPIFDAGTRVLPDVNAKVDFSEVTPMVNLSYDVTDGLMTYGTWSRGFKSGGFTQRVFPPIIPGVTTPITDPVKAIPSFDPEKVDAFELGVKFQSSDRSVTINAAGFYTKYKDMQVQVFTSVAPVFTNAGKATIKGFELETQLRPLPGLFLEATAGLTDAAYDEIDQATTFINPANAFERVSKWTLSAAMTYEHELSGGSKLRPRVDWSWRSKFYNNSFNTPQLLQPGYHMVNASLGWTSADDRLSLSASVKNIADKRYLLSGISVDAVQTFEGVYNRGREWSLSASVKY
jgi:iron complex outermembrane receptor protein